MTNAEKIELMKLAAEIAARDKSATGLKTLIGTSGVAGASQLELTVAIYRYLLGELVK